jgi:hypothetical protein
MLPNSNIKTKLLGSLQEGWLHNGFYSLNMVQIAQQNKLKTVIVLQKVVCTDDWTNWLLKQLNTKHTYCDSETQRKGLIRPLHEYNLSNPNHPSSCSQIDSTVNN